MKINELLEVAPTGLGTAIGNVLGAAKTGYAAGAAKSPKTSVTKAALDQLDKMTMPKGTNTPQTLAVQTNPLDVAKTKAELARARDQAKRDAALQNTQSQAAIDKEYRDKITALSRVPGGMVPETKLNEYSLDFTDDLETLIRNQLGRADGEREQSTLSYKALSRLLGNMIGKSITLDKDTFEKTYNANTQLQNYVEKFDKHGVTLSTKVKPSAPNKTKLKNPTDGGKTVSQMARGGLNYMKKTRN